MVYAENLKNRSTATIQQDRKYAADTTRNIERPGTLTLSDQRRINNR